MPQDDNVVVLNPADDSAGADQSVDNKGNLDANGNRADTSRERQPNQQQEKVFTYKEDRTDWVPRHRLKSGEQRAAEAARKETEDRYKLELESRDKKLRILAGVDEGDPKAAEDAKVRAELERILGPGVSKLTPEFIQKLERALVSSESAEQATRQVWEDRAETMVTAVEDGVASVVGGDLTPRQQRDVRRMYRDAAEEAAWLRANDPDHNASTDFLARHERGDKTLIKELVDSFTQDWVEPIRRKINSDASRQYRAVPRGERGQPMTQSRKPVDLSKPGAFEDAMAAARREEGRGYRE